MKARRFWLALGAGLFCSTLPATPSSAAVCGNEICESGEAFSCPADCGAELSMDAAGDSITKALNAYRVGTLCTNLNQENFNWATSNTHGSTWCGPGIDGVFSHAERIECSRQGDINVANPNHAASAATMLAQFVGQATGIQAYLSAHPAPRYATIFLGHNDMCRSTIDKSPGAGCANSDQDPANYCRTRLDAFEREFRKGLELLITVPDTHIGVAAPLRSSQYCNFAAAPACLLNAPNCQKLWQNAQALGVGLCQGLTHDCSPTRIIDAYTALKAYKDILEAVTAEYSAIPDGGQSQVLEIGGEVVGGATKASGVTLLFSEATWKYKLKSTQISCCDCMHPLAAAQNVISRILWDGLTCGPTDQCCADTGDPLSDGKCATTEASGFYGGIY